MKYYPIWKALFPLLMRIKAAPANVNLDAEVATFHQQCQQDLKQLEQQAKNCLSSKHDVHLTLYPIVVYCDEQMNLALKDSQTAWPSLQKLWFDRTDGGERFFTLLDQALHDGGYPAVVYQVYYWLLKDGYQGKLANDEKSQQRQHYLNQLSQHCQRIAPTKPIPTPAYNTENEQPTQPLWLQYHWMEMLYRHFPLAIIATLLAAYGIALALVS